MTQPIDRALARHVSVVLDHIGDDMYRWMDIVGEQNTSLERGERDSLTMVADMITRIVSEPDLAARRKHWLRLASVAAGNVMHIDREIGHVAPRLPGV